MPYSVPLPGFLLSSHQKNPDAMERKGRTSGAFESTQIPR